MFRALVTSIALLATTVASAGDPAAEAAASYRLETKGTTPRVAVGERGTFVLSIVPIDEVHVHPQAPLKVVLESTVGLKLEKSTLGKTDPVDPKADGRRFEVPFVASAAGPQEARAKIDFFICSDRWCVKQVKEISASIEVK